MPILGGGSTKGGRQCRHWDTERSSISTNSSATSNSASANWTSSSANKLSKFGRRIRDSCRNLRVKQGKSKQFNPEDYTSFQLPNESVRSKVYVAMDFTGADGGRVLDNPKDIRSCDKSGPANKEGYVPFRRRVAAGVFDKLTETQATIHKSQDWFHAGMVREKANKILQAHANTDGVFLVRESSVSGGFVISYTCSGKLGHTQVLPVSDENGVTYTADDGRTKFYDLLQLVEFYQLNPSRLPTRLVQFIVNKNKIDKREQSENQTENGFNQDSSVEEEKSCGEKEKPARVEAEVDDADNDVDVDDADPDNADADVDCRQLHECDSSLKSEKMAASSASEEGSAMSQDGASEDETANRDQKG